MSEVRPCVLGGDRVCVRDLLFTQLVEILFMVLSQDRDVKEGADMLMVKPGLPYLDIVREVKDKVSML